MDKFLHTNPLEAVQFVSIFSYLNSLSDFLFIEKYLMEEDQNKQIPVVNALYNYLEDNKNNNVIKVRLIRKLLQGTDLYGENIFEKLDQTFVNAMFEYIISSLVFEKYANIYGFLAEVVQETKCFQLNSLLQKIEASLKDAKFENQYGENSRLSNLAAEKIFIDIILPLFPQAKSDFNILSIDYIYAQAGSIFLRTGRPNTAFYAESQDIDNAAQDEEKLFEQYLAMGHLLRNTLNSANIHSVSFNAFALPTLFYYVHLGKKNVRNVIYDSNFWKVAFLQFYIYLDGTLNEIKNKFEKETKYQIHSALLGFKSYSVVAKSILDKECKHLKKEEIEAAVREYLYFPEYSQCGKGYFLPNLNQVFLHNVNKVTDMYKIHDMKIMQQSFGESFLSSLNDSKVVIQLLAPDDKVVLNVFDNNTRIPYDLIVIHCPENSTADFYALIRENYTMTIIKESDDPTNFRLKTGLSVDMLLSHRYHRVTLKTDNQTMNVFWENLMTHKVQRLTSYLKNSGKNLLLGEWWKEFGLSLMPFYSCIENTEDTETINKNFCELNEINFLHQWDEDISSELTNSDIRSFLKTVSTTFKSSQIFLTISQKYNVTAATEHIDGLMEKLVLHMEKPGFDLTYLTEEDIDLMQTAINTLKQGVNNSFSFVINILNKIKIFKKSNYNTISHIPGKRNQTVFIKTDNVNENTGYGYRFANFDNYTVQLRTDYQSKKQIFVAPLNNGTDVENIYFEVNLTSKQIDEPKRILYDINNQLQTVLARRWFVGLSVHENNIKDCNNDSDINHLIPLMCCPRHARSMHKRWNLDTCLKLALSRSANLTHDQVLEAIGKYTFPDGDSICLQFVEEWTNNKNLKIPTWGEQYIIDNSPLLSNLRYQFSLDSKNLSIFNGTFRIFSNYAYRERKRIEFEESMEDIIKDFNNQQACYMVTFEDFYAIRNFATTGYTRITGDTFEAKQMKAALYKLSIRQSDDPDEEFDQALFKFESKPEEIVERTLTIGRHITLQKFTTTIVSKQSALTMTPTAAKGFINILYEFKFSTPYVRAKIKEQYSNIENTVILLPGSEFLIESIDNVHGVLIVILKYMPIENDKYNWYKKIMKLV